MPARRVGEKSRREAPPPRRSRPAPAAAASSICDAPTSSDAALAALAARVRAAHAARGGHRFHLAALVQSVLDSFAYNSDRTPSGADDTRCPSAAAAVRKAHCFDGALLAASLLVRCGVPAAALSFCQLEAAADDDDHMLLLFRVGRCIGAVSQSQFAGLRFRDPVFRNLRELALSYWPSYFNAAGRKTLRGYTAPVPLPRLLRLLQRNPRTFAQPAPLPDADRGEGGALVG